VRVYGTVRSIFRGAVGTALRPGISHALSTITRLTITLEGQDFGQLLGLRSLIAGIFVYCS